MASIFSEQNAIAEAPWFKFENVGDKVEGKVVDIYDIPARDQFSAQIVYLLERNDGSQVNVGVKNTPYNDRIRKNVELGSVFGILFEKEIPPTKKGFNPTKSLKFFGGRFVV